MSNSGTKYTICVKDGKAYQALTVQGMKSYTVCPGDGKLYNVSEGTTTYSIEDDDGNQWKSADILFGATLDFDHAYIDTTTNVVHEYYNLDSSVSGGEGQIVYGFEELAVSFPVQPAIAVHIAKAAIIVTIFLFIIFCLRKMTRITRLTQRLTQHRVQRHKGYLQCPYRKTALSNCQNRQGA